VFVVATHFLHQPYRRRGGPQYHLAASVIEKNTWSFSFTHPCLAVKMALNPSMQLALDEQLAQQNVASQSSESRHKKFQANPSCSDGINRVFRYELETNKDQTNAPSQVELLEAEIEELESLLDGEQSKSKQLQDELNKFTQDMENLKIEHEKDFQETEIVLETCMLRLDKGDQRMVEMTQKMIDKDNALSRVEMELLESRKVSQNLKQECDRTQQDLSIARAHQLQQEKQWSNKLATVERDKQSFASQLAIQQAERDTAMSTQQDEGNRYKLLPTSKITDMA
jgi:hypothetical protein